MREYEVVVGVFGDAAPAREALRRAGAEDVSPSRSIAAITDLT